MRCRYLAGATAAVIFGALYLLNASWLAKPPATQALLLSHRGDYQHYDHTGLTNDTCTAVRIYKPTSSLLENTIPSMAAAIKQGADMVEIDVHPTTDGQFAVFHDWTLDCRTDGHGVTRDHTLAELKALDIGYGYTYDGGKTFPFRGQFKGQMPSLQDVLTTFPDTRFLINIKSNDPREGDELAAYLDRIGQGRNDRLRAYGGGDKPLARLAVLKPNLKPFSVSTLKACAFGYMALGWSGYMPRACHNTTLYLPLNFTWLMWGYPNRLQDRFAKSGSYIYLLGDQKTKVGLNGINSAADYRRVPKTWRMGILTDDIATVGPLVKPQH